MKHVLVSIILLGSLTVFSQDVKKNPKMQKERILERKVAFLTEKLELTSEESEQFWPIYNEMTKKIKENRMSMKKVYAPLKKNKEELDDSQYRTMIKSSQESREKNLKIIEEYTDKIGNVLGFKKVYVLSKAEKEFKKGLMERMKKSQPGKKDDMDRHQRRDLNDKN